MVTTPPPQFGFFSMHSIVASFIQQKIERSNHMPAAYRRIKMEKQITAILPRCGHLGIEQVKEYGEQLSEVAHSAI
jgi:hypothetical protein